jgi:hypothetical protein
MIGAVLICAVLSWSDGDSGRCDGRRFRLHGIDAAEGPPLTRCRSQPTIWACRPENRRHAVPAELQADRCCLAGCRSVMDAAACRICPICACERLLRLPRPPPTTTICLGFCPDQECAYVSRLFTYCL